MQAMLHESDLRLYVEPYGGKKKPSYLWLPCQWQVTWLAWFYKSRYFPYIVTFNHPGAVHLFKKKKKEKRGGTEEDKPVAGFPAMFSAATQLSLKGSFQNMLSWKNSRSSQQAVSPEASQSKRRDIFSVLLTPDRIPKFCIPPLEVERSAVQAGGGEGGLGETSPGGRPSEETIRRPRRVRSSPEISLRRDLHSPGSWCARDAGFFSSSELRGHSDPVTQAALSLPHLAKITTPYGFLTLGECPKVHQEESLFFECESTEFQLLVPKLALPSDCPAWKPSRSLEASSNRGSKAEGGSDKGQKKLFQLLMKKHLPSIRKLKSHRASEDRFGIQSELLGSCPSASLQGNSRVQ